MRGERKHHDSAIQRRQREQAERKSVGFNWKELPMKILFWPDELERPVRERARACQLGPDQECAEHNQGYWSPDRCACQDQRQESETWGQVILLLLHHLKILSTGPGEVDARWSRLAV